MYFVCFDDVSGGSVSKRLLKRMENDAFLAGTCHKSFFRLFRLYFTKPDAQNAIETNESACPAPNVVRTKRLEMQSRCPESKSPNGRLFRVCFALWTVSSACLSNVHRTLPTSASQCCFILFVSIMFLEAPCPKDY